jgi:hypothetical protein
MGMGWVDVEIERQNMSLECRNVEEMSNILSFNVNEAKSQFFDPISSLRQENWLAHAHRKRH